MRMRPYAVVMAFALFQGVAPAHQAAPAEDPAATLRNFVIHRIQEGGGQLVVLYKTAGGRIVQAQALSGDEDGMRLSAEGKGFSVYWDELGEADLYEMCRPLLGKSTNATVASLLLGLRLNKTEEQDFKGRLSELWTRDVQAALKVEEAIDASRPPKAGGEWFARVVDAGGTVNPTAYRREAYAHDLGTVHRRLGPDYAYYHKDTSEKFPTIWKPADKASAFNARGRAGYTFQLGDRKTAQTTANAETSGQVLYIPDKPGDPGIDRINTWDWQLDAAGNHSFIMMPEPCSGQSHPEPGVLERSWKEAAGGRIGPPVATARGLGFKVCSVTAFASGLIGAAGTNTSGYAYPCLMLPRNKAPTAVAVTNGSEFALVAVWDTAALKGQVAVIALESSSAVRAGNPSEQRPQPAPGLWNWGILTGMKLLGFVDLPGMNAPTEIAAVGNRPTKECSLNGRWAPLGRVDLAQPSVRESYWKGENRDQIQSAGFAVVISKYEKKAAFVDLRPLFQYYREMYFASPENFEKTRKSGPGPKEWPTTFEAEPRCKPRVVATLTLPSPPTAVHASPFGGAARARAFVATLDGRIRIYSVGGLAEEAPSSPAGIQLVGYVPVGRNPTRIAYVQWDWDYRLDELIVCCRGDREICFVKLDGSMNSGAVTKRLRDSRLADPVSVENTTTAFNHCFLISVCDFKGRQVINYRYGAFTTQNEPKASFAMGPDGKAGFECGGWMQFPGRPFRLTSANVP